MTLLAVAAGGALGSSLRYLTVLWAARVFGAAHHGTLIVNALGSLIMGLAAVWLVERMGAHPRLAPFMMTGLLGGFTTFSAFSLDALRLIEAGRMAEAGLYMAGTVLLALGGLWLGLWLGRALVSP